MKFHIITLGCPKNAVDSEGMHGLLLAQGHVAVERPEDADAVIVNTCSFIQAARDETLGVLRELGRAKRPGQRLIAAGCMAESHREVIRASVPEVDATLSTREWMRVGEVLAPAGQGRAAEVIELLPAQTQSWPQPGPAAASSALPVIALTPDTLGEYGDWRSRPIKRYVRGPSAYLKISDGCNLRCAFCAIPSFKGDLRSKPLGAVLGEARELVAAGVQEIILVAQHLTDYGRDLGLKDGLATLLAELCQVVPAERWIRLMYAYPASITPAVVRALADHPQVVPYLDMPLQHAHPETLRRMRRPPDTDRTRRIIGELRAAVPDIAIRTTFIVGFPGETREEFEALLRFLDEMEFDRAGFFMYSDEAGTHAATLPGKLSQRVKQRRLEEAAALQRQVAERVNRRWLGRSLRVLVEGRGEAEGQPVIVGRSFRDAPEIDNLVWAPGDAPVGSFVEVRIERTGAYDAWGVIVDQPHTALATAAR
ncbi:30S ribosomal protein S12 methylthiotransferase RimO [Kallotenue papyrolyticum]|uniref:30S ribosomal protein S12 methylthiotransferase RimO n=1 Tax=Kallotenue papyrolyticum TaxID=1325125 RepID=UPI0004923627|nr:30S ribosomal protein S12 methylthiotransferase RimO [Kallotenue papyrolyticum]